jgi:hypothetical protein
MGCRAMERQKLIIVTDNGSAAGNNTAMAT